MDTSLIEAATLSQTEFDQAEAMLTSLLRESYPHIDLRRGTAVRELLVTPASAAYALESRRNDELLRTRSLVDMLANPKAGDAPHIDAVLANFGAALREGRPASGVVKITVAQPGSYRLAAGSSMTTGENLLFRTSRTVEAKTADGTLLGPDQDGYLYFLAEVVADAAGGAGIREGQQFSPANTFSGYLSATSYADFANGEAAETLAEVIKRLPETVASRGLSTRAAIISTLKTADAPFSAYIADISIQGMSDKAQRRDRHNLHGIPQGGKLDVYARTFAGLPIVTRTKTGVRSADGSRHTINLRPDEVPGWYAVRSVTAAGSVVRAASGDAFIAVGSYDFQVQTYTTGAPVSRLLSDDPSIGTVYRGADISVSADTTAAEVEFKVELYAAPFINDIQMYVDGYDIRALGVDTLIRSPFVCVISVGLVIRLSRSADLDIVEVRQAVVAYINQKKFGDVLTMSEILSVVHSFPILDVSTTSGRKGGFSLRGYVLDGGSTPHTFSGHVIDVDAAEDPTGLLCRETCVFATALDFVTAELVYA